MPRRGLRIISAACCCVDRRRRDGQVAFIFHRDSIHRHVAAARAGGAGHACTRTSGETAVICSVAIVADSATNGHVAGTHEDGRAAALPRIVGAVVGGRAGAALKLCNRLPSWRAAGCCSAAPRRQAHDRSDRTHHEGDSHAGDGSCSATAAAVCSALGLDRDVGGAREVRWSRAVGSAGRWRCSFRGRCQCSVRTWWQRAPRVVVRCGWPC